VNARSARVISNNSASAIAKGFRRSRSPEFGQTKNVPLFVEQTSDSRLTGVIPGKPSGHCGRGFATASSGASRQGRRYRHGNGSGMIQNTLENRIILYLLEALLGGLVFLISVGKKLEDRPRAAHGSVAFAFACFSGDALARGLFTIGLLRGRGVLPDQLRLFIPPSVLETMFLGALVVGLLPSRRGRRLAAVLLAVLASAYPVLRLAFLQSSPGLYDPPDEGAYLHVAIALLLCVLARRASPRPQILFQSALALLAASYVSEAAIELYSPGALFFWNVQHAAKILALLSFVKIT